MNPLKIYNTYNDIRFIFNTCTGYITPRSFCIGMINLVISHSNTIPSINKEIYKALVSSLEYA